ncbi:hypothetical protein DVH24_004059 [Malus domestica]|uniref:Uncharacterized protein n=1 Tax=Malus domestica TaxID=3750 RepID=A0A498K802_MALDO|nr:hypothetical protein DVH24_004059 [Malus domestica]
MHRSSQRRALKRPPMVIIITDTSINMDTGTDMEGMSMAMDIGNMAMQEEHTCTSCRTEAMAASFQWAFSSLADYQELDLQIGLSPNMSISPMRREATIYIHIIFTITD